MLGFEKSLERFLCYGEKKVKEDGLEAVDTTFLDVLADMLKQTKSKMIKYAEPIMMLAKNIIALKVSTSMKYFSIVLFTSLLLLNFR